MICYKPVKVIKFDNHIISIEFDEVYLFYPDYVFITVKPVIFNCELESVINGVDYIGKFDVDYFNYNEETKEIRNSDRALSGKLISIYHPNGQVFIENVYEIPGYISFSMLRFFRDFSYIFTSTEIKDVDYGNAFFIGLYAYGKNNYNLVRAAKKFEIFNTRIRVIIKELENEELSDEDALEINREITDSLAFTHIIYYTKYSKKLDKALEKIFKFNLNIDWRIAEILLSTPFFKIHPEYLLKVQERFIFQFLAGKKLKDFPLCVIKRYFELCKKGGIVPDYMENFEELRGLYDLL